MNMLRLRAFGLPALTLLLAGTSLHAQVTTGTLSGKVVDDAGRPVAQARITLQSPALFQDRVITTDARGEYRAALLPVGNYTVKVTAEGYLGRSAKDLRVGVGSSNAMNFDLRRQAVASQVVEVVATGVQEAKTADKTSVNFSATQLLQLPSTRSFDGALALSPGVTGSGTSTSIRGSEANQVLYRVDGIDVKDDTGNSTALYQPLPDSIEDVQVVLSALNARYGRSQGGQVNVVTKSGSNTFEGSMRGYMSRPSWRSDIPGGSRDENHGEASSELSRKVDLTFSGPIIKDRLWFYLGTRLQPSEAFTRQLGWDGLGANGETVRDLIKYPMISFGLYPNTDEVLKAGPGGTYKVDLKDHGAIVPGTLKHNKLEGKLTGQLATNHILSFTFLNESIEDSAMAAGRGTEPYDVIEKSHLGTVKDKASAWTLGWDAILSANWSLETRAFKATREMGDFMGSTADPQSVIAYFSTGDANTFIQQTRGSSWLTDGTPVAWYGPVKHRRMDAGTSPDKRGNQSLTMNLHGVFDAKGQHELDAGFEVYQSLHNFGRNRVGGKGIFVGGFFQNAQGNYLYPTFWTERDAHGGNTPWVKDFTGAYVHWTDAARGPSATMERFWVESKEAKNGSTALWANDTWTINDQFNVMAGARYNRFVLEDAGGKTMNALNIFEPRMQVKWNPDGQGKELLTFTAAKLATAYSDQLASQFRGNEWNVRTVHRWMGLKGQPAANSPLADTDVVGGRSMYGVRFVDYATLIDSANYDPRAVDYIDSRQTFQVGNLRVPYAIELGFGYQRNYETGFARINLVQRTYKDEWVARVRGYGRDYMVEVQDPSGQGGTPYYKQTQRWLNSEFEKTYRGVELVWQEQLTSRLTFGGSYTWSQTTGVSPMDYYNYRNLKEYYAAANHEADYQVPENHVGKGILSKDQSFRAHLTYVHPLGKGNVSASLMGSYWTSSQRTLAGSTEMNPWGVIDQNPHFGVQPTDIALDWEGSAGVIPQFYTYYSALGAYKYGSDYYTFDLKLQAQVPVWRKMMLVGHVQINNVFNRVQRTRIHDWDFDMNTIPGRPLATFNQPWGSSEGRQFYQGTRNVADFSIGLKF